MTVAGREVFNFIQVEIVAGFVAGGRVFSDPVN